MTSLRQRLIDLYSSGPIEEVHAKDAYQKLVNENIGDRPFDGERNMIQELRSLIDQQLRDRDSYSEQIEFALRLLRRLDTKEKVDRNARKEACRQLIILSYGKKWETEQLDYFEKSSRVLIDSLDYFLSFTNRNPGRPNQNEVNRLHKHFIIDSLGREGYDRADRSERNLVAEAVHYHLGNRQLRGFYYPSHEGDNTLVRDKLSKNLIGSLTFVQLVQAAIFNSPATTENWCFFEYDTVRTRDGNSILFVQIEEDIKDDSIDLNFDPWFKAFKSQDPVKLKETRWHTPQAIDSSRSEIREKLADQIQRALDRIYLQIPS